MNLKTGQDLPLSWTERLRNLAVVRSFFMADKDGKPPALWEVLVFFIMFCFLLPTMLHLVNSVWGFVADLLAHAIVEAA